MSNRRMLIITLFAACGVLLGSAADAQVVEGSSVLVPQYGQPYGYGDGPYGGCPPYGHRNSWGYGSSPYDVPYHSYGKYLFHVKYKYPELDHGLRHSPSWYYEYRRPIIILPAPAAPLLPAEPPANMDESSLQRPPIPSPDLAERFLNLAQAANGVVVIRAAARTSPQIDTARRPMTGDGWTLLRKGDATAAYRSFTIDAANDPHNSLHRIGYAIAAAMWDDRETSVWAMRRAIRLDPSAMLSVETDDALFERIAELRRTSMRRAQPADAHSDDHFMLAAMNVLLGDVVAADQALNDAVEAGDQSESAENLHAVIDAMIRREGVNRIAAAVSLAQ